MSGGAQTRVAMLGAAAYFAVRLAAGADASQTPSVPETADLPSAAFPLEPDAAPGSSSRGRESVEQADASTPEPSREETLESVHDDLFAERMRALSEYDAGKVPAAHFRLVDALQRCISAESKCSAGDQAAIWLDLGIVLAAGLRRSEEAVVAFRRALALSPAIVVPDKYAHPLVKNAYKEASVGGTPSRSERPPSDTSGKGSTWGRAPLPNGFMPLDTFHAGFTVGSGVGWLSESRPSALSATGPLFHIAATFEFFDLLTASASVDPMFPYDSGGFSAPVEDDSGHVSVEHSSAQVVIPGLSAGLRTPDYCLGVAPTGLAWYALSAYTRVGYSWVTSSRSIGGCLDCESQSLGVDGEGAFVQSGLNLGMKAGDSIGGSLVVSYRYFVPGSGVDGQIQIGIGIWYF